MAAAAKASGVLPPGFNFNPSEEQLISYYLKRKNNGIKEEFDVIPELDFYKNEPWDLPDKSILPSCDMQWYFFSPCDRKYPNGSLANKATEAGYWTATGRDRKIRSRSTSTGVRRTLVFYKGRYPHGEKTKWLLHEYHLHEDECENAFVLCHVFRKSESAAIIGDLQTTPIEKCDSSPEKSNPDIYSSDDNEEQSEDRSKKVEEIQTNSSLQDMTENGTTLTKWFNILVDDTSSSSLLVKPGEDTIHKQVDGMPQDPGSECDPVWTPSDEGDFPQIPADLSLSQPEAARGYLSDGERILDEIMQACQNYDNSLHVDNIADILNGDYLELNDLEDNISVDSSLDYEVTGIQLRPPTLQSYQQGSASEGTSKRIRLQLHKMEATVGNTEKYVTGGDIQCAPNYWCESKSDSIDDPQVQQLLLDSIDQQKCNLEILAQNESSATAVSPRQVINGRNGLFFSAFETDMKDDTIFVNGCEPPFKVLYYSSCSGIAAPDLSITEQPYNSETSEKYYSEGYALDSKKISTIEVVEKGINSTYDNPITIPTKAAGVGRNSTSGESLTSSGAPSVLGPEKNPLPINSSEIISGALPDKDAKSSKLAKFLGRIPARPASAMELTSILKSDKHILGQKVSTDSGSIHLATAGDHVTATTLNKTSFKGSIEYSGSDTVSSGLRYREVLKSNNLLFGGEGKRTEVARESYERSTGVLSQRGERASWTRSHGGVVATCLFGTAFLFVCFLLSSGFGLLDWTLSAIGF